jgi:hypothetical protein
MRCIITLANNDQLKDLIELAKDLGVEVAVEDESEKTAEPVQAETQAAPGAASEPEETAPVELAAAQTTETHAA